MKKYIAFDFGAGTTCVAEFNGIDNNGKIMWRNLPILTSAGADCSEEIPTYLGGTKDNSGFSIGGYVARDACVAWKARAWKTRPTKAKKESENLTKIFMREVFMHFSKNNKEYLKNNNDFVFAIGYPCDWSDEDAEQYKQWAENSYKKIDELQGKTIEVVAIKESQAAMLYARKSMDLKTDSLKNGVLLIDMGSSTTDFTYIEGLSGLHCGIDLGANDIDVCIAEQAVNNSDASRVWYDEQINNIEGGYIFQNMALFDFFAHSRESKEKMYACNGDFKSASYEYVDNNGEERLVKFGDNKIMKVSYYNDEILNAGRSGNHDYTDKLKIYNDFWRDLEGKKQSWRQHFRDVLKIVRKKWNLNKDALSIVVTGGASRMTFVENDIRSIFGQNVTVRFCDDDNKSFSVVRGLAYAAYANDQLKDLRKEFQNSCDKIVNSIVDNIIDSFAQKLVDNTVSWMCSYLERQRDKYFRWKDQVPLSDFLTKRDSSLCMGMLRPKDTFASVRQLLREKLSEYFNIEREEFNKNSFSLVLGAVMQNKKMKSVIEPMEKKFGRQDLEFVVKNITCPQVTQQFATYIDLKKGHEWGWTEDNDLWCYAKGHNGSFTQTYWTIAIRNIREQITESVIRDYLKRDTVKLYRDLCSQVSTAIQDYFGQYTDALTGVALIENQN